MASGFPSIKELHEEFGMSIYQIKERFPNVTDEDLRKGLGISKEQLKEELRIKTKKKSPKVKSVADDPLDYLSEEEELLPPLKAKKPLRRKTELLKDVECPMASAQTIRDRLAKIGVVDAPPLATTPKIVTPIHLGPKSEISEKEILESVKSGKEVELSLGRFYGDSFKPGVPVKSFMGICRHLGNTKSGYTQYSSSQKTIVEIDDSLNIRKTTDRKGISKYQEKVRGEIYNSPDLEFRISVSEEKDLGNNPPGFRASVTRERYRTEFLNKEKTLRVDMTMVVQTSGRKVTQSYEVEIEMLDNKGRTSSLSELINQAKTLMMVAQEVSLPERLITRMDFAKFIEEHNFLLKSPLKNFPAGGYWNKPTNLTKMDLLERGQEMAITPKLDGERRLLIITDFGVFVNARPDIFKIGHMGTESLVGSVLDCEYYEKTKTYWVFDVLIFAGIDIRSKYLPERDKIRRGITVSDFKLWEDIKVETAKPYFFSNLVDDIYTCAKSAAMWQKTLEKTGMEFDGFIFQSTREYGSPFSRKWKPANLTTIDFLLSPSGQENYYTYSTFDTKTKRSAAFTKYGVSEMIFYKRPRICGIDPDSDFVAECVYVQENSKGHFEVHRERPDRSGANESSVAEGVWRDIIDPISIPAIFGYDMKIMQYAHNRTKETMLRSFQNAESILDLGTGQGGDLGKWSHEGIKKVFVVEPDPQKITELKKRHDPKKHPQIEIIKDEKGKLVGTEDTKAIRTFLGDASPVGISAFFSLTFLGQSKLMVQQAVDTISSVLTKPGQMLIGIVMDGKQVHKLLDQVEGGKYIASSAVNNNEIFSIKDTGESSPITSSFSSRKIKVNIPGTFIQDLEEWTFPFEYFSSLMRENGFYLKSDGFLSPTGEEDLPISPAQIAGGGIFTPKDVQTTKNVNSIYNNLPFHAKVFSSLQRFFVFVKGRKKENRGVSLPTLGDPKLLGDRLAGVDVEDLNLEIHYTPQDSSAIFNAFLETYDEEYHEPSSDLIESLKEGLVRLKENAKSTERTKEDYERTRKRITEVEGKLALAPKNSALKKQLEELKKDLTKNVRNEDDRFDAKTKYTLGKDKLTSALQNRKIELSKIFRAQILVDHITKNKGLIPKSITKRYQGTEGLIKELKDTRREIPPEVALTLITSLYRRQKLVGILVNSLSDEVTCFGCPTDLEKGWTSFIIYQTLSGSLSHVPVDESSSLRKHYYPVFSGGKEVTGIFPPENKAIKKLVKAGC